MAASPAVIPAWIGVIGTVAGTFLGGLLGLVSGWAADKRRFAHEERQRRLAERGQAYLSLLESADRLMRWSESLAQAPQGLTVDKFRELLDSTWTYSVRAQVLGSRAVRQQVVAFHQLVLRLERPEESRSLATVLQQANWGATRAALWDTIRRELGVPD